MKNEFIEKIAPLIKKYGKDHDILCSSAVIAQACLESGYGESVLSSKYHNYFGLKCGTAWHGKSVRMRTAEDYESGMSYIADNFRAYDSMEDGVKGYFEFLQLKRYENLKGIKLPRTYLELIAADGYATDRSYVKKCMDIVERYNLRQYDGNSQAVEHAKGVTAQDALDVMRSWLGCNEHDGSHMAIVDLYNCYRPLARGVYLTYNDSWCDATVSACFIKLGAVQLIGGTECGVEKHIQLFQDAGIWIEDGTITPQPGDIICYNWDDDTQPNDGWADHIGMVEAVNGRQITVIEGNCDHAVRRMILPVGAGNIRGYARPKYSHGTNDVSGSGKEEPTKPAEPQNQGAPSKEPKWVGKVTADILNVRIWAGVNFPNIRKWPQLSFGNMVDVCDTVKAANGSDWYYVRIAGVIFGFVSAEYIAKA